MDSPRPSTPLPSSLSSSFHQEEQEDERVYRSIFQQPQIDIPPTAPSYAWFEFLLHPQALHQHVRWYCIYSNYSITRVF
jgi:hypothetical protein